jgi:hypothetical protein
MSTSVKMDPFVNRVVYAIPYAPGIAWEKGTRASLDLEQSGYVYHVEAPPASNLNPNPVAEISVRPMSVLTLKPAECGGECTQTQHGWGSIKNAKRYYLGPRASTPNAELVGVSVGANPGHVVKGLKVEGGGHVYTWEGHGTIDDYMSLADMVPAVPNEDGLYVGDDLYVEMTADATVTPVVEPLKDCLVVKAGNELTYFLDADATLSAMGYSVTKLDHHGLTEQEVIDAIPLHGKVFVFFGHGIISTGTSGGTNPVWSLHADEVPSVNSCGPFNLVYLSSCCSAQGNNAANYLAAFGAECFLGWIGTVSGDDKFDEDFWNEMEAGQYAQAAVATAMSKNGYVYGVPPYPRIFGNTKLK